MILKRIDKQGNKTYVDRWTGRQVILPTGDPLTKAPDPRLLHLIPRKQTASIWRDDTKKEKQAKQKSAFIGNLYQAFRTKPENRIKKDFILACKHCNINPYPLLLESPAECFKSIGIDLTKKQSKKKPRKQANLKKV